MKRELIAGILCVAVCCFTLGAHAETAKKGTAEYQAAGNSKMTVLKTDMGHMQANVEVLGVITGAPPNCPLHNATFRVLGSKYKGGGSSTGIGFIVWTRPDKEKIYGTMKMGGEPGKPPQGQITLVGGTGMFKGITGSVKYVHVPGLQSSQPGNFQLLNKAEIQWEIP
ncbi:MAG: hypothetical protein ABFS19_04400 [Thermodesulfobacteriota bacterium]